MKYYDVILGLIPVVFGGIAGGLLTTGFELTVATPLTALGAIALIGHAMFVNGPTAPNHNLRQRSPPPRMLLRWIVPTKASSHCFRASDQPPR